MGKKLRQKPYGKIGKKREKNEGKKKQKTN